MDFEKQKQKNILDLEYSSLLNYMNVFLISLATLTISVWVTLPKLSADMTKNTILLINITLGVIIIGIIGYSIFIGKLEKIKKKIRDIK